MRLPAPPQQRAMGSSLRRAEGGGALGGVRRQRAR
jgi:hypothetical protein